MHDGLQHTPCLMAASKSLAKSTSFDTIECRLNFGATAPWPRPRPAASSSALHHSAFGHLRPASLVFGRTREAPFGLFGPRRSARPATVPVRLLGPLRSAPLSSAGVVGLRPSIGQLRTPTMTPPRDEASARRPLRPATKPHAYPGRHTHVRQIGKNNLDGGC